MYCLKPCTHSMAIFFIISEYLLYVLNGIFVCFDCCLGTLRKMHYSVAGVLPMYCLSPYIGRFCTFLILDFQ